MALRRSLGLLCALALVEALAGCGGAGAAPTGSTARERYSYRMQEQVQFNAAYPDRVPRAVPGVGERSAHNQYASWIPAYSTL